MTKVPISFLTLLLIVTAGIGSGFAQAHITKLNAGGNSQSSDEQQPRLVLQLGHVGEGVTAAAYSPDGRFILTGSYDKTACLWDSASGRELRRFKGHEEAVNAVSFSPDGRFILTGAGGVEDSLDNSARLWDIQNGREIRRFEGHTLGILSLAFSADGRQILSGGYDKSARLWDVATGRQLLVFKANDSLAITSVSFIPNSRFIVIGGWLRPAQVWDKFSGTEVRTFPMESLGSSITALAVSPDGLYLITAENEVVRLWNCKREEKRRDLQDTQVKSYQ